MSCYRCGRYGHYASECYARTGIKAGGGGAYHCFRCGRKGHFASECYAKTSVEASKEELYRCFRCGRQGHFASECYARTSVKQGYSSRFSDDDGPDDGPDEDYLTCERMGYSFAGAQVGQGCPPSKKARSGVYVLKASNGLHYVGKSNDIDTRIEDHAEGEGASCIASAGAVQEVKVLTTGQQDDLESWERNETLLRMKQHGIDRVRGWMFTSEKLTEAEKECAFRQICEKFDLCRRCGREGHFADVCYAATRADFSGDSNPL